MMAITFLVGNKNRALRGYLLRPLLVIIAVLTSGLITACQPPTTTETAVTSNPNDAVDSPIIINAESVTMAPEYILSIKPSRYQPSLGLQGKIEPIKQAQLLAAQDIRIQQVLVTKGQWVKKGTPLLIVQRQNFNNSAAKDNVSTDANTGNSQSTSSTDSAPIEPAVNTPAVSKENATIKSNSSNNAAANEPPPDNLAIQAPNKPSINSADVTNVETSIKTNTKNLTAEETVTTKDSNPPITIFASFSGRVNDLYVETTQQVSARGKLLHLEDDTDLRFIATLPIQAESQLSVGQNVNFTTNGLTEKFTGQVSKLLTSSQSDQLLVYVHVIKNEASRDKLQPDMAVTGRVDYGQIEVGTIVPERSIHNADLTELQKPPYRPLMPLIANVWTIKQDQRLTRQPVEVIEYDPSTGRYLIAGISNDSLICLADLPLESAGKKVIIS